MLTGSSRLAGTLGVAEIGATLKARGFVALAGEQVFALLGDEARASWPGFAHSWNDLGKDLYMADGGRYRRRRHAALVHAEGHLTRKPHQPHYQSRDYNPLNGDVQRWFEPVLPATMDQAVAQAAIDFSVSAISHAGGVSGPWHIEFHQFRIETTLEHVGRPTPEGLHRDGVDWVFVMLVARQNVREGITEIGSPDGAKLGSFLLQAPGDAVLLDDHRILHGVTEIHAIDQTLPAYRDVLVITFARSPLQ